MKSKILSCFALVVFLTSAASFVFAEDVTNEVQTVRRETRSTKQIARTADKSKEKSIEEKFRTGVTYEDVLKDPDNIQLNFRYAQNQISKNELLGASSTLERILLIDPNLIDVRLLYAVVLYRLDSLNEVQKELNILKGMTLPPEIKREVDFYEKKIKYQKRRTHFSVRESAGWGYDTNRNASPSSKQQLFFDTALDTQGSNTRKPDTHFLNVASLDVTHDLGFQAGHTVFAISPDQVGSRGTRPPQWTGFHDLPAFAHLRIGGSIYELICADHPILTGRAADGQSAGEIPTGSG